ncbi:MAG: hypothetical protein HC923_10165 [Myxococcales bacterium]|nr:hypothetical protein [Myxococcales bacterium]
MAVRPSGTEPKLKVYLEAVGPDADAAREKLRMVEAFARRALGVEEET